MKKIFAFVFALTILLVSATDAYAGYSPNYSVEQKMHDTYFNDYCANMQSPEYGIFDAGAVDAIIGSNYNDSLLNIEDAVASIAVDLMYSEFYDEGKAIIEAATLKEAIKLADYQIKLRLTNQMLNDTVGSTGWYYLNLREDLNSKFNELTSSEIVSMYIQYALVSPRG